MKSPLDTSAVAAFSTCPAPPLTRREALADGRCGRVPLTRRPQHPPQRPAPPPAPALAHICHGR